MHRKARVESGSLRVVNEGGMGFYAYRGDTRHQPEILQEADPSPVLKLMPFKWQAIEGDSFFPLNRVA